MLLADGRTLKEIAERCKEREGGEGMLREAISAYLSPTKPRPIPRRHLEILAEELGSKADKLFDWVEDKKVIDAAVRGSKPSKVEESPVDTSAYTPSEDLPDWKKPKMVWVQEDQDKVSDFLGSIDQIPLVEIPVYGPGSVAAGVPADWPADYHPEGTMLVPANAVKKHIPHYGVPVAGDSMEGVGIMHGMTVAVRPEPSPDMGQIVVALVEGSAVVKRIVLNVDGIPVLISHTIPPDCYQDIPITEYVIIVGVVVWWGQQQGRPQPEHPARKGKKKTK